MQQGLPAVRAPMHSVPIRGRTAARSRPRPPAAPPGPGSFPAVGGSARPSIPGCPRACARMLAARWGHHAQPSPPRGLRTATADGPERPRTPPVPRGAPRQPHRDRQRPGPLRGPLRAHRQLPTAPHGNRTATVNSQDPCPGHCAHTASSPRRPTATAPRPSTARAPARATARTPPVPRGAPRQPHRGPRRPRRPGGPAVEASAPRAPQCPRCLRSFRSTLSWTRSRMSATRLPRLGRASTLPRTAQPST